MATKLSDILSQESSGIMFPFQSRVKPVTTEQQVYSPTEGIMNVKNTAYEGPDATITYGSEDQGYPRQLKEIEKGMLPQFDQKQFPDMGKGKVETTTTPTTKPVEPDKAIMDPCPAGFKLINGVCQPIEQQTQQDRGGRDRPTFTGPKISKSGIIEGYQALDSQEGYVKSGAFYDTLSSEMKAQYDRASKYGRGLQVKYNDDGELERIVATSPTLSQLAGDIVRGLGDILEKTSVINLASKVFDSDKEDTTDTTTKEAPTESSDTKVDTTKKDTKKDAPTLTSADLGGIDKISDAAKTFGKDFGTLNSTITKELEYQQTMSNELQKLLDRRFPPQMGQSQQKKLHDSKIKEVRDKISESRVRKNIAETESNRKDKAVQDEVNNSRESNVTIGKSTYTVHKNSKGKTVGYSTPGSNTVQVVGFPPVGPGLRIKTKPNRFTKRAAPVEKTLTGGKLKGTKGFTRGK